MGDQPDLDLRLETAAKRARRILAPWPDDEAESVAVESAARRVGLPDDADARLIARTLARRAHDGRDPAGRNSAREADALARKLVERARDSMLRLLNDAADGSIDGEDAVALEAVMFTRGRPALRVEGPRIEALDPVKHPGSEIWRSILDDHEAALVKAAGSTAAVRVQDRLAGGRQWLQGTAWMIGDDRVLTNRHVLFPENGGHRLARRRPDQPTEARLREHLDVQVDFAFDDGDPRSVSFPVTEILFVAEDRDPVDAAVLRIAAPDGDARPGRLRLAREDLGAGELYVIGHPGRLPPEYVPEDVQAVFGSPDDRKRVSFGTVMQPVPKRPFDLLHDASTIGGYSGGCVLGVLEHQVAGLHYYGDPENGNRAVLSSALFQHQIARFLSVED